MGDSGQINHRKLRPLRVTCVGAGYSGLMLAHAILHSPHYSSFLTLQIYEKNAGIGVTWFENRYPGAACDIPAHIYGLPFAPNPGWSNFFVGQEEILAYIEGVAEEFRLKDVMRLNSRVTGAVWSDKLGKWTVKIQGIDGRTFTDEADVLVNGTGYLSRPKLPEIPGLESFEGDLVHSAVWKPELSWAGKRVAVVGNGSSGIQVLPHIQETASHVVHFIRQPTWIMPGMLGDMAETGTDDFSFTEAQKRRWREDPEELEAYSAKLLDAMNGWFDVCIIDSPGQQAVRQMAENFMKEKLHNDPALISSFVPTYPVGARRPTPGPGYLEALQQPNVTTTFDLIVRITPNGIVTNIPSSNTETSQGLDIIILATGFNNTYSPPFPITGQHATSLNALWHSPDTTEAYLSIFAPKTPNYFIYNGPNSPIGHGSLIQAMDATTKCILRCCEELAEGDDARSMIVKDVVLREYNDYTQKFLREKTVWADARCRSWYKNGTTDGRVVAMYAGSVMDYVERVGGLGWGDFEWMVHGVEAEGGI